jgi:carbonic anhydrase
VIAAPRASQPIFLSAASQIIRRTQTGQQRKAATARGRWLGHANCGAVHAAIEGEAVPGQISALYPYIRPAVDQAGPDLTAAIKANAKIQAALLRQSSPVLAEQIKKNQLQIVAAYYDLATGKVSMLG